MPLQSFECGRIGEDVALWRIAESETVLSEMVCEDPCPEGITHLQRRREWLAGRVLAKMLAQRVNLEYRGIGKDESGRPFLKSHSYQLSLSHSFPYVAAQLCASGPVGIDVERPREKLLRVTPRVLSLTEIEDAGDNITKLCVYWCAKEALYKMCGKKSIPFATRSQVKPFDLSAEGRLLGVVSGPNGDKAFFHFDYMVHTCFVLVCSRTI